MPKKQRVPKVKCRSVTVRSLAEFVDAIHDLQDEWSDSESEITNSEGLAHIWFRGHPEVKWRLTPKIFRTKSKITVRDEEELFGEFVRRGGMMLGSLDEWLCYFVMQHHGLPTRLLDWTDGALVALYFALREGENDAAVWAMNPLWLNSQTVERYALVDPRVDPIAEAFRIEAVRASRSATKINPPLRSLAVRPQIVSSRMFGQRSLFTLHGSLDLPIEQYPFINRQAPLCRIVIPKRYRHEVMVGMCYAHG